MPRFPRRPASCPRPTEGSNRDRYCFEHITTHAGNAQYRGRARASATRSPHRRAGHLHDDHPGYLHRDHRLAGHPRWIGILAHWPELGAECLHAELRRLHASGGKGGRHSGPTEGLSGRAGAVHAVIAGDRAGAEPGDNPDCARGAGRGGCGIGANDALALDHPFRGRGRALSRNTRRRRGSGRASGWCWAGFSPAGFPGAWAS